MKLKERYQRLLEWKKEPFHYSLKNNDLHHCNNCGNEFTGNYCPICGQDAEQGAVTWSSVWRSIMILWGMDSRSMLSSLLQLILRPGYMIADYIKGRRQISYPPVKMVFILAIFYVVLKHLFGIKDTEFFETESKELELLYSAINWMIANPGWAVLSMTMILIIPTWLFFRYSPRNTRHTFPQSIFIQLFMSSILLLIQIFNIFTKDLFVIFIPVYYYITYQQMFGYRFWGTTWRLMMCAAVWSMVVILLSFMTIFIPNQESVQGPLIVASIFISIFFIAATLAFGYFIGWWQERKRLKSDSASTDAALKADA